MKFCYWTDSFENSTAHSLGCVSELPRSICIIFDNSMFFLPAAIIVCIPNSWATGNLFRTWGESALFCQKSGCPKSEKHCFVFVFVKYRNPALFWYPYELLTPNRHRERSKWKYWYKSPFYCSLPVTECDNQTRISRISTGCQRHQTWQRSDICENQL